MNVNIFRKSSQGLNLTPAERSFLRLLEGLLAAALVAALPVVADALSHGAVNWSDVGRAALAAAATAVLLALIKWAKAQGDAPLTPSLANVAPSTPLIPPASLAPVSAPDASRPDPFAPLVLPDVPDATPTPAPSADAPATPASA